MAETAPLSSVSKMPKEFPFHAADIGQAHAHVRKAAEELEHVHWTQAADEHQQASTDFARAAKSTSDTEVNQISAKN